MPSRQRLTSRDAKKFMCIGALPPQDHPHVFCDMGEDVEYVCPYCCLIPQSFALEDDGQRSTFWDRTN